MARIVRGWRRGPWEKPKKDDYARRDILLLKMGFASYREYLASRMWRKIREAVLEQFPMCQCCDSSFSTAVHHVSYDFKTMKGRRRENLVAICDGCHLKIEFYGVGKIDSCKAVNNRMRDLMKKNGTRNAWVAFRRACKEQRRTG
jgi:5-methylcytosine-specific restriction endonuclease McrA